MNSSRRARAVADHVALGQRRRRRATIGLDRLAEDRVGHADDRRLAHAGELVEHVLDFLRAHLLAAGLDDVVLAADEIEVAVLVGPEEGSKQTRLPPR